MSYENIFALLGVIGIILISIFIFAVLKAKTQKKQAQKFQKKIQKILNSIQNMPESQNNQKILEYDKVLDSCLYEKISGTKNRTTGGKMKVFGTKFLNTNAIWSAHKLRNTIAHQIGFQVSEKKFREAEKSFQKEILALLKK